MTPPDSVNHPPHYNRPGVPECDDVIEALNLNFRLGNVLKYLWRAGVKPGDALTDLRKAAWYLLREIERREEMQRDHPG